MATTRLVVVAIVAAAAFATIATAQARAAAFPANPGSLGAIPDGSFACDLGIFGTPRNVTFDVSGLTDPIADVRITGLEVTHTWVGDLDVELISPAALASHTIFSRTGRTTPSSCGDSSDLAGPYEFADDATPPHGGWWQAASAVDGSTAVPPGAYRATAPGPSAEPASPTSLADSFVGLAIRNGTWTLRFRDAGQVDTGAVSAATLQIVTDPDPPVTTITSGPSDRTANPVPSFTFSANEPAAFRCRLYQQSGAVPGFGACSGPGDTHTAPAPLTDGAYTFEVMATDVPGNVGEAAGRAFIVTAAACAQARTAFAKARKRLRKAKRAAKTARAKLKRARRSAPQAKIAKAKKRVKRAQRRLSKTKAAHKRARAGQRGACA